MNGLIRKAARVDQPHLGRLIFSILSGFLLGAFVLVIFRLPMKFTYFFIGGPIVFFIAIITGHFKRFFQALLIFIIPLNFATHFFRRPYLFGEKGLVFSPLDIVLILLYLVWFYELLLKRTENSHLFPAITIPGFILVGVGLLGMLVASDPYFTLFESVEILKSVLLFLYVANHVQNRRNIHAMVTIILISLFLQSVIAMSQKWLGVSLGLHLFGEYQQQTTFTLTHDYYLTVARVGGTIGHPNNLAKYVELLIPLSAVLLFTKMKLRNKMASAVVFVCAFIVLIITLSRGGWVCFAGSMGLVLLLVFRARLINLRTLVAIAVVAAILMGATMGLSGMVTSRLFGDDYGAAHGRIPLNRIAMNVIRANPLLGVGAQNYWMVMNRYNPNVATMKVNIVHNAYLLTAAEMGLIGLAVFVWLMAAVFRLGIRNLSLDDVYIKSMNIGIVAGLSALWAHWMVDPGYPGRTPVMWVLAALIVASPRVFRAEQKISAAAR